jgi:FkbM family methyltransferase
MNFKRYWNTIMDNPLRYNLWLVARKFWPKKFGGPFDHLEGLPRFTEAEVQLLGKKIKLIDVASFQSMYNDIFKAGVYKFETKTPKPYIIDCGANIGLSVIFFKNLFPSAEIVAFEPDAKIFSVLENNLQAYGYSDIKLVQKALWNKETELEFFCEGADGGRLAKEKENIKTAKVKTARLRDYLNRPVDFLKIDIESAEVVVLKDCADLLTNVKNVFIEYHRFVEKEQELHVLLNILDQAGFRYYLYSTLAIGNHPFIEKNTYSGFDMQVNIFACRP